MSLKLPFANLLQSSLYQEVLGKFAMSPQVLLFEDHKMNNINYFKLSAVAYVISSGAHIDHESH